MPELLAEHSNNGLPIMQRQTTPFRLGLNWTITFLNRVALKLYRYKMKYRNSVFLKKRGSKVPLTFRTNKKLEDVSPWAMVFGWPTLCGLDHQMNFCLTTGERLPIPWLILQANGIVLIGTGSQGWMQLLFLMTIPVLKQDLTVWRNIFICCKMQQQVLQSITG